MFQDRVQNAPCAHAKLHCPRNLFRICGTSIFWVALEVEDNTALGIPQCFLRLLDAVSNDVCIRRRCCVKKFLRMKSFQYKIGASSESVVGAHKSQRQKPSLICCVVVCHFHSFLEENTDAQLYTARRHGNDLRSSVMTAAGVPIPFRSVASSDCPVDALPAALTLATESPSELSFWSKFLGTAKSASFCIWLPT